MQRLSELLPHVNRVHSAIQIQHFIVTKGGAFCDYGAFRTAVREVHGRTSVVRNMLFRVREIEIDVAEAEADVAGLTQNAASKTSFERDRERIRLARSRCDLEEMKMALVDRARELAVFYACACALKDRIELSGQLTPLHHAKLDRDMWIQRMCLDVASDMRLNGKISRSVFECVLSLPESMQKTIRASGPNREYELPKLGTVMTGQEVIDYVADVERKRIGTSGADDAPARRVLEGVTG